MKKKKLTRMVTASLLLALILLFGLTSLGMWNFGIVYISLLCLPVIIGTVTLGLRWGCVLGLAFGAVSFFTNMRAPSALVAPILERGILWLILLCFVPRLMVPVITHLFVTLVNKHKKNTAFLFIPAIAGSLTNTFLFLGGILFLYTVIGVDNPTILTTLGSIVLAGGLPEAAVCGIVVPPVILALKKAHLA